VQSVRHHVAAASRQIERGGDDKSLLEMSPVENCWSLSVDFLPDPQFPLAIVPNQHSVNANLFKAK
jgi:hypothetical protein